MLTDSEDLSTALDEKSTVQCVRGRDGDGRGGANRLFSQVVPPSSYETKGINK